MNDKEWEASLEPKECAMRESMGRF